MDNLWDVGEQDADQGLRCQMDQNDAREDHYHENVETLQTLLRLFLLYAHQRIFLRFKVFVDDLGHQLGDFEQFKAVKPVGEEAAEVCPSHQHECLLVVENPRLPKVLSCVESLPEKNDHYEKVADEEDSQNPMHEIWLVLGALVQAEVAKGEASERELEDWGGDLETFIPLIGLIVGFNGRWTVHLFAKI